MSSFVGTASSAGRARNDARGRHALSHRQQSNAVVVDARRPTPARFHTRRVARSRPITDVYIAAVERAIAAPGRWIEVPRRFQTQFNANVTAVCLRGGYLRVEVRDDDTPIYVAGKRYLKTPAPVHARVERDYDGWLVRIRHDS